MYRHMHAHSCCCTPWESLTKKEKLGMLREKKQWLEEKAKNVAEAIEELERGK